METRLVLRNPTTVKLRFNPGATGPAGEIAVGTVTTGAPGSSAAVTNVGTVTHAVLDFTIPRGNVGPANSLAIGTVSTVAPGGSATASITGTAPSQTLNLGIPRGDVGPAAGPGSIGTTELADRAVTVAKMQAISTSRILGRTTASSGDIEQLTAGSALSLASGSLNVATGGVTLAMMADLASQTIIGRNAAGTGVPQALSATAVRSIAGQKWVSLLDETLVAPGSGVIANLFGFDMVRIVALIVPNAAVADFFTYWRGSTDGTNFDFGASDYANSLSKQAGTTLTGTAVTLNTYGQMGGTNDTGTAAYAGLIEGTFYRGSAGRFARMQTRTGEYDGTNRTQELYTSDRIASKAFTHLQIASNITNGFGIGSRFIVEGAG